MIIYPAMDLLDGCCVRLKQGRFDEPTRYAPFPADALRQFEEEGAEWAHIVDLDGVRAGSPRQHELIAELVDLTELKLQVAGGIREAAQIDHLLSCGVDRVVIGSLAVTDPRAVQGFFERFGGDRITLALDVIFLEEVPMVAAAADARPPERALWDVADRFPDARHLMVTDVGRHGMLSGPNLALVEELASRIPEAAIQVSGGVSSADDIRALARAGAAGAIVGKALWDRKISLVEAIEAARD
jgi:phosphoribosylformimino-5-aminoimidazole carboxamide ribotide isomerase